MRVELGEILLKEGMVTPHQVQEALSRQRMNLGKLGAAFVSLDYVKDEEITSFLARHYEVTTVDPCA